MENRLRLVFSCPGIKNASPSSLALESRAFRDTLYTSSSKPQEFADSVYGPGDRLDISKRRRIAGMSGDEWNR